MAQHLRINFFPPLALVALLTGCASLEPATPADYTGPTVHVADQAVQVSGRLVHVFEMTQVDGRRLATTSMATVRANQGRGFSVTPVALTEAKRRRIDPDC